MCCSWANLCNVRTQRMFIYVHTYIIHVDDLVAHEEDIHLST